MPKSHRNSLSETRGWDTLGEEEVPKKQKNEPQRANNLGMAHCGEQPGGEEEGRKKTEQKKKDNRWPHRERKKDDAVIVDLRCARQESKKTRS